MLIEVSKRKKRSGQQWDKRTNAQKVFGYCPKCGKWFRHVTVRVYPVPLLDEAYWNSFIGCDECQDWHNYDMDMRWENTCGR